MVDYDLNQAKKEATLLKENLISPTWEHPVQQQIKCSLRSMKKENFSIWRKWFSWLMGN